MTQTMKKFGSSLIIGVMLSLQFGTAVLAIDGSGSTPTTQNSTDQQGTDTTTPPSNSSDPAATGADPSTVGPQGTTGVDPSTVGPQGTTGADPNNVGVGSTVTPVTGPDEPTGTAPDWVYNTATGKWQAADVASFTWDRTTGYWLSPKYYYDTRTGWYEVIPASGVASLPSYMITAPKPANIVSTPIGDFVVGSPEYELAKAMGIIVDPAITNTGPNSTNNATVGNNTTALVDFTNIVRLANSLKSDATTGNANVSGNTEGADATTGSANVMANVVNMLDSVWNLSGGPVVTFVKNVFGNMFGDLTLTDPSTVNGGSNGGGSSSNTNTGPNSTNNAALTNTNDLTVHASNTGTIDNNIDLSATSGNANVSGNTVGGNATTGDANVALNLINMINSAISANGSFIGILNVFGDFNGDVLFSDGFVNKVLASGGSNAGSENTGPNSTNNSSVNNTNNLNANFDNNTNINNDITSSANSGNANVGGNTSGGMAHTGNANTNSSVMNLNGTSVTGDSAMLVIVNVMGHWLGGIMSLPGNVASALLGSGDSSATNNTTGPNSSNNASVDNTTNANYDVNNNLTINNHANLTANSGDANVSGNTVGGNATTGNANILSSVANVTNTAVNLRKWFGILIINVFGNWTGSVGKDTAAGSLPAASGPAQADVGAQSGSASNSNTTNTQVVAGNSSNATGASTNVASQAAPTHVLGSAKALAAAEAASSKTSAFAFVVAAAILLLAAGLAGLEKRLKLQAK